MRRTTITAGAATALVLGGVVGFASPAFAHTPTISADCQTGVVLHAENYDQGDNNVWFITVNDVTIGGKFKGSTNQTVPFPQEGRTSTWHALIDGPGTEFDEQKSGSVTCGTTPTTPPVTQTPTPEPTTPPVTETPTPEPTTPPVTETPTPTPTASTPPVVVTPEPEPTPSATSYVPTMPTPDKTPVAVVVPKDTPPTTGTKASTPTGELAFTGSTTSPWVYLWSSLAIAVGVGTLVLLRLRRRITQR